jgi:demethylmenaquinone methyltransferase / 2-methoxy-6-polyprenyl-1,4-benzoquinol methylase
VTGKRQAYEYLNRSSMGFPARDQFLELMCRTGKFSHVEYRVLMGGASYMYKGVVK